MILEYNSRKPFLDLCRVYKDFLMHHNRTQKKTRIATGSNNDNWKKIEEHRRQRRNFIGLISSLCCFLIWLCLANFLEVRSEMNLCNPNWSMLLSNTLFIVNDNIVFFNSIVLNAFYILITYKHDLLRMNDYWP